MSNCYTTRALAEPVHLTRSLTPVDSGLADSEASLHRRCYHSVLSAINVVHRFFLLDASIGTSHNGKCRQLFCMSVHDSPLLNSRRIRRRYIVGCAHGLRYHISVACMPYPQKKRWRACRLGPGALFGDRPVKTGRLANPNIGGSSNGDNGGGSGSGGETPRNGTGLPSAKIAEKTMNQSSALETAVTTEPTELLEIGLGAYHRFLAHGVKERIDHAVAVLRATGVMVCEIRFLSVWRSLGNT